MILRRAIRKLSDSPFFVCFNQYKINLLEEFLRDWFFFCFDALSRGTAFSTFREPRAGQTLGRRNARAMSEVNGARVDLATRRTLVMSVRYALRISVDDATEETPSAAYRSGSPEAVESGAAGIVAEAVLDERSRQKARGMCRRRASGRGCGGRIRGRPLRTAGRVAGVVAVVRDARRLRAARASK